MKRHPTCCAFHVCHEPHTVPHATWLCREYDHLCECGHTYSAHQTRDAAINAVTDAVQRRVIAQAELNLMHQLYDDCQNAIRAAWEAFSPHIDLCHEATKPNRCRKCAALIQLSECLEQIYDEAATRPTDR